MPLFTHENAATMAAKGNAVRWSRPRTQTPTVTQPAFSLPVAEPADDFANRRLMRVREQLERLDRLASEEDDPKQLKALADATTRLSEQERLLAGRPLPGSRRPGNESKGKRADWWIEMQPSAPVAPAPPPVVQVLEVQPVVPAPQVPERLPGDVTP